MSFDEIQFCLHTANKYLWELLRQPLFQILGLSQSSRDTISILFKDILLHNLTQLSRIRNKTVILHYHLTCSDSPVVTSCYDCLLLSTASVALFFHCNASYLDFMITLQRAWYSDYSHNYPRFINTYSVSENSIFMTTDFLSVSI